MIYLVYARKRTPPHKHNGWMQYTMEDTALIALNKRIFSATFADS